MTDLGKLQINIGQKVSYWLKEDNDYVIYLYIFFKCIIIFVVPLPKSQASTTHLLVYGTAHWKKRERIGFFLERN